MNRQLVYTATPIIELRTPVFVESGVRVLVKREDLNHVNASGNKWWKLKYNLQEAFEKGHTTLLTFGGAYSNHIYATAAAARELGLKSIGIIRGEETLPINPTLTFAKESGMQLHYVSREDYRKKNETAFIQELMDKLDRFYLIPEGGTNALAIKGCTEFARQLSDEVNFDYLCLPVGTGGTMAGMIEGFDSSKQILGFSALKGGEFLEKEIKTFTTKTGNWRFIHDYHFGGYAKTTNELLNFMHDFEKQHQLPLDQVYTAKMVFGIFDLVQKEFFKKGTTILVLHTGGLQGRLTS